MNISGKIKIFRNQYDDRISYKTSISNKVGEQYQYYNIDVQLPKGKDVLNNHDINVKNGFLSFYYDKDNNPRLKAVIMEYEEIEQSNKESIKDVNDIPFEVTAIDDDMLPF